MVNDIRIIRGRYVRPDTDTALRLAGYQPGPAWDKAGDICRTLIPDVRRSVQAKAALSFAVAKDGNKRLYVITTLGAVVSQRNEQYFQAGRDVEALLFGALADSCLFAFEKQLLPQIRQICLEKGVGIERRHEAGVDIPLAVQDEAVLAVAGERTLGVTVSKNHVMSPGKSLCLIFDLTPDTHQFHMEHDCRTCSQQDCSMRSLPPQQPADTRGRVMVCPAGMTILNYIQQQGVSLAVHCGGKGICGACRVRVCKGRVPDTPEDRAFFSADDIRLGWRLACCAVPAEEAEIMVPAYTENPLAAVGEEGFSAAIEHTVSPDHTYGIAIDIGTTTLAAALVDMTTAKLVHTVTAANSQRVYGADVVSRMAAAGRGCGPGLQHAVQQDLVCAMGSILERYQGIHPGRVAISANTTMQHLLMGYSCEGLGEWPFHPVSLGGRTLVWDDVFTERLDDMAPGCSVQLLPGISTYVGADIVAGLWHCHIDQSAGLSLFIDMGTNGEMALGDRRHILVTSTSAGPALEGGHLSCGIGSVAGAICSVSLSDGQIHIETIGHGAPAGLCGTGVIEGMAALLENGYVDATGKLRDPYFAAGFAFAHRPDGKAIGFNQEDIRDIQMAKGAIRAGMETLLHEWGAVYADVQHVYLAGGFGYYLDPQKAAVIGLLPHELAGRTIAVGNTSLAGAADVLTEDRAWNGMKAIASSAREIILGNMPEFQELYIRHMEFSGIYR
ncbi:MAG: ASKHA domain-containing protein [Megasphaera sp.]|jgi:uncharacterized 2Fe-2S/4Fe-4S cluster protein (DUF4445 family)|nr:ASKHA domain-containing protein [Megasphaera sp.]